MSLGYAIHDPESNSLYVIEWAPWLDGATISNSVWTIDPPAGVTLSGDAISGTSTSVKVSGILDGRVYQLTNQVTTPTSVLEQRSIQIRGGQR